MRNLTVKLPESLAFWLSRRAKELGRPRSEIVREVLELSRKNGSWPSCHDLKMDVCGSVDGSKDLSTHSKYLNVLEKGN